MELASFLAGERWSDRPRCTHPLVASVARMVNDSTSDDARQRLAGLIPAVIGTSIDDPRLDVLIARRAAITALPVAAAERQRVLAVGILASERLLAQLGSGGRFDRAAGSSADLERESREALEQVPDAFTWACAFSGGRDVSLRRFRGVAAPAIVRLAVTAVGEACVVDRDVALRDLLERVITEARRYTDPLRAPSGAPATRPDADLAVTV